MENKFKQVSIFSDSSIEENNDDSIIDLSNENDFNDDLTQEFKSIQDAYIY